MKRTHIITGVLVIPLSLWCLIWLIPGNTVPPTSDIDLSPALVPSIAVGACLLTALVMMVKAWRASDERAEAMDEEFGTEATGVDGAVLLNLALWTVASAAAWMVIEHFGFEPAMTLLIAAIMLFIGIRGAWMIVSTAVLMPIVLSQAAWYFFDTQMPGIWH